MKIILFIILCCNLNHYNNSTVEIYASSYYGIKEEYEKNIKGFISRDSEIYITIENDSIVKKFEHLASKLGKRNIFNSGVTKTVIIINTNDLIDTILIKYADTKVQEYKEISKLTNKFLPLNYEIR